MAPSVDTEVNSVSDGPLTVSKFYEAEDRLAQNLTNDQIVGELADIVGFMRQRIDGEQADTLSGDGAARDVLLLKAVRLRRLNRLSNFRNRLLRERLAASRAKVDAHYLQLQNLRCGIGHLRAATAACIEFASMDRDLDLVPVDEFRQRAGPLVVDGEDEHQLHLARLKFELEERKTMQGNLQELEGRRSVLISDIRGKESRLRQIKANIGELKESARPLLNIIGLNSAVDTPAATAETGRRDPPMPRQLELDALSQENNSTQDPADISPSHS